MSAPHADFLARRKRALAGVRDLNEITITRGSAILRPNECRALDLAAWWTNAWTALVPDRVSPVLARYVSRLNDRADRKERQKLKIPALLLDRTGKQAAADHRAAFTAVDYAARIFTPNALRAHRRRGEALILERLPPIVNDEAAKSARVTMAAIRGCDDAIFAVDMVTGTELGQSLDPIHQGAIFADAVASAVDAAFASGEEDALDDALECLDAMLDHYAD